MEYSKRLTFPNRKIRFVFHMPNNIKEIFGYSTNAQLISKQFLEFYFNGYDMVSIGHGYDSSLDGILSLKKTDIGKFSDKNERHIPGFSSSRLFGKSM